MPDVWVCRTLHLIPLLSAHCIWLGVSLSCVCVWLCGGNRLTQAVSFKLLLVSSVFFINDLGAAALWIPAIPPPDSLSARQMLIVFIIAGCAGPVKRAHLTLSTFPFNVFLCAAPCSYHSFSLSGWPSADKGSRLTLSTYYACLFVFVFLSVCARLRIVETPYLVFEYKKIK